MYRNTLQDVLEAEKLKKQTLVLFFWNTLYQVSYIKYQISSIRYQVLVQSNKILLFWNFFVSYTLTYLPTLTSPRGAFPPKNACTLEGKTLFANDDQVSMKLMIFCLSIDQRKSRHWKAPNWLFKRTIIGTRALISSFFLHSLWYQRIL